MKHALEGKRVLLTRSVEDNRAWSALLHERGAVPLVLACIRTTPSVEAAEQLVRELGRADWLALSSRRAVDAITGRDAGRKPVPLPERVRVACVGPATAAAALEAFGRVDKVAPLGTGRSLGAELAATLPRSARVVVAAAQEGRVDVEDVLRPAGIDVRRIAVYRTEPVDPVKNGAPPLRIADLAPDAIFLASPSAVRGLLNQALVPPGADVITLGPTTTAAARDVGLEVRAEAKTRGLDGLCDAYAALLEARGPERADKTGRTGREETR